MPTANYRCADCGELCEVLEDVLEDSFEDGVCESAEEVGGDGEPELLPHVWNRVWAGSSPAISVWGGASPSRGSLG